MVGGHIVPLSVKTHHKSSGKDMHQCHVMHDWLFRDRTLSTCPLPMLGEWLDRLAPTELEQGLKEMEKTMGNGQPPTTQSKSILIKALNEIDSKGKTVW